MKSPFGLMMDLFVKCNDYLNNGKWPHYFVPECNLLATVGHEAWQIALKSINAILSDPIAAVLKCPTIPIETYGDILPDELVAVFYKASTHPCSERSMGDLLLLLSHLDDWRQNRHHEELEWDNKYKASGRPKLRGLVQDILEQTNHIWCFFI